MKLLILDNYDSFTYNLYQCAGEILVERGVPFTLHVKRNDEITRAEIKRAAYDRIIILSDMQGWIGGGAPVRAAFPGDRVALSQELDLLTATVNEEGQNLRALERFMVKAGRVLAALPSRWPVRGAVNSEYGRRLSPWSGAPEFHSGIDIASERGFPVKAPAPGTIVFAGTQAQYGNTVILDHGNDIKSLYGHLQKIQVTQGQRVERGQVIALSGNTGKTTGPHVHYEILVKGQAVNPRGYLWD